MSEYCKPVVLVNEGMAEGVYAASGSNCYTVTAWISQRPETGRENYVICTNAYHNASANHHSTEQVLTLTFNQPVTFVSCSVAYDSISGDGTNVLEIKYTYHNNEGIENIGLGNIYVESAAGLADPQASLSCNYTCEQHT